MKSLQDYIEIYRGIAKNLNLQGDSVEMISQMLANATYISEVEHVAYSQEASLEKATLINSKIQHCMNEMYSVFRGTCPRVIIKFKSTKYFRLNIFDEISSSNNFKIYYLGYLSSNSTGSSYTSDVPGAKAVSGESGFIYAPTVIPPTGDAVEYTIIGLLAKEVVNKSWTLKESNTYYVDFTENDLSNDLYVKVNGDFFDTTRIFSDHITNGELFDLTLPSFGLRFYAPDIFRKSFERTETPTPANTTIDATVYKYCTLDSFNQSELKQVKIKGANLTEFTPEFLSAGGYTSLSTGLIFLNEVPRDSVTTIHYKANRDRYVNSILRSNSDIGTVLEEMYPEKIRKSGTHYIFKAPETTRVVYKESEHKFSFGVSRPDSPIKESQYISADNDLYVYATPSLSVDIEDHSYTFPFAPNTQYKQRLKLNGDGVFISGDPSGRVIRIPINKKSGTLKILHKSSISNYTVPSVYDILPSISVILKEDGTLKTTSITVHIMKYQDEVPVLLTSASDIKAEGISISYSIDSGNKIYVSADTNIIEFGSQRINEKLTINLENKIAEIIDTEIIPVIESSSTQTSASASSNYVLNLTNDTLYLESDYLGNVTTLPVKTNAILYVGGQQATGVSYEILQSPGVTCSINQDGIIEITGMSQSVTTSRIPIRATLNNVSVISILTIRKSILLYPEYDKPRSLLISSDKSGLTRLAEFKSPAAGALDEFYFDNVGKDDFLYIWSEEYGINLYEIIWVSREETVENLIPADSDTIPSLEIYYIPYTLSNLLTTKEIQEFKNLRSSYYVTNDILVKRGNLYKAVFTIKAEVYQNISIDDKVEEILNNYKYTFDLDLESKKDEITALLNKISNVKQITDLSITYTSELGDVVSWETIKNNLEVSYFNISYLVNSIIYTE